MQKNNLKSQRIETLDWLRGLMALSIMFYHITPLIFSGFNYSSPLGRLGIYGVSIFFILSGLCMAIVYNSYIKDIKTSLNFFIRRIFRIWPLLWMATILMILLDFDTIKYSWQLIFLNCTTLFGFIKPNAYIVEGAWSIGNEMVFYALTPAIIYLFNRKKSLGNFVLFITILIGLFFSFYILNPNIGLGRQMDTYVNPFNNLFLYVMGIAMYYNLKDVSIKTKTNIILLFSAALLFCFLPFNGDRILIVTGFGRILFVFLAFIIVFCFYKMKPKLPIILEKSLTGLGLISYGIYLYHPIIYKHPLPIVGRYVHNIFGMPTNNPIFLFFLVSALTIIISKISYEFFELKFIKIGKHLTSNSRT